MDLFTQMNSWHWGIAAVIFVVIEVFAPGAVLVWLGVAAAVVGILLAIFPGMSWETQFLIFAVLSVASIYAWRSYSKKHPTRTDQPNLNLRGQQYVGRVFTLEHPVVNGKGKIRVDDTSWKIEGDDCEAGTKVRVIGVDGVVLRVEQA